MQHMQQQSPHSNLKTACILISGCVAIAVIIFVPLVLLRVKEQRYNSSKYGTQATDYQLGLCTYRTQNRTRWAQACNATESCLLDHSFGTCFDKGVVVGCSLTMEFTNATLVRDFLTRNTTSLAQQRLLVAKLNVGFHACNVGFGNCTESLASLTFSDPASVCKGHRIYEVISAADHVIGGCGVSVCASVAPLDLCKLSSDQLTDCLGLFDQESRVDKL